MKRRCSTQINWGAVRNCRLNSRSSIYPVILESWMATSTDYWEVEIWVQLQLSFPLARCTCVIFTGSSHGGSGLKIKSMVYLLMMENLTDVLCQLPHSGFLRKRRHTCGYVKVYVVSRYDSETTGTQYNIYFPRKLSVLPCSNVVKNR